MRKLYKVGPFLLDPEVRALTHEGAAVSLGTRAVMVLSTLVSHANEYVEKSAILDAAWPGLVVEEANLAVQISAIRRVLARVPGGEGWIETLPRRGYRFVGPVAEIAGRPTPPLAANRNRTNLPELLTSFVGRERELAEIKQLLPRTRLLTLTGTGGIGKTRLAQQAAAEVLDAYRDGIWFIDLAPLHDPALVPSALAQVLRVPESAGQPLINVLCSDLLRKEVLLILDNCEHVLDACARLVEALLRETAHVTIIATSREPLHLAAEHAYPLAVLPLPDPHSDAETIAACDAVRLFVERTRQYRPHFDLQQQSARAVAEICVRLDGIPLALELAAARVAVLPVEQIERLLDQRFRLLTSGSRELPRHQTLRAMIDWSYELLDDAEKALFARLSVFAGGWTLAAATVVCGGEPIVKDELAYVLIGLIEQSLVVADEEGDRYRFLDTIRAYAVERLSKIDEAEIIGRRHAQYFRDRFAHAPDDWLKLPDSDWNAAYLPERDNIRAALEWALSGPGEVTLGIDLTASTGPLWSELSLLNEGQQRFETAIARSNDKTPEINRARLWLWQGLLWGAAVSSQAVFVKAADAYRRLDDATALGHTLARLSIALTRGGQFESAAEALKEAFPLLEHARLPKALAHYYRALAFLDVHVDNAAGARGHFEQAASLYRVAGSERNALSARGDLANLNWELGNLDAALQGFKETVARMKNASVTSRIFGVSMMNLQGVHIERGELAEALVAAREGLPLLRDGGYAWLYLDCAALGVALSGRIGDAAHIIGYADSMFLARGQRRSGNEARAHARLHTLLRQKLAPTELQRLLVDGAKLTVEEVCKLALAHNV